MRILALDVGATSVQAAVLDAATGNRIGPVVRLPVEVDRHTPDAAEIPPQRLWEAVTRAARTAAAAGEGIEGVGLCVTAPTLVLLDRKDHPLGPIWTPLDRRSRASARHVWNTVGEEFLHAVGSRPLPGGISAVCFRQRVQDDPYLTTEVHSYLHLNGWLGLRLTAERAFDPANASLSGLFDTMTERQWSERWCRYFEVEPEWLPPVRCGSTTLGPLRSAVAAELGVPPGIPVKLGTTDISSALLGAGIGRGELLHHVGATQLLATILERPVPAETRQVQLLGVGESSIHATHNPLGGPALAWLHALCFREQSWDEFRTKTIPQALDRPTRVTLDPPNLAGDRLEIDARRAAFRDLTLTTDRLDLLAALLSALREQHRKALDHLGVGERFERVTFVGDKVETLRSLLPPYPAAEVVALDGATWRGIAYLFTLPVVGLTK